VKSRISSTKVLIAVGFVTIYASIGSADQNSLRTQAEAELAHVTMDVDSANIMYSPADDGLGQSLQKGKYVEALQASAQSRRHYPCTA
jgi:hypothetical protein